VSAWQPSQIPAQTGKVALITGANSGIGFEAARGLARAGAHVVLACRDLDKAHAAEARLRAEIPDAVLEPLALDLSHLESVRVAARHFASAHEQLDVLCNNAGVMAIPRRESADGFEMQFAVNHLGHFALTGMLLPTLLRTPSARIVTVSSSAHRIGSMRFDDLDGARSYHKWVAYGQSKLANLLFAYELHRKLAAAGAHAISVACHPGYAATNLQHVGPQLTGARVAALVYRLGNALIAQSAEHGAWPTLYAATAPDVSSGDYIGPSGPGELFGKPEHVRSSSVSHDVELARRLWQISVARTGVDYAELESMTRACSA
jgi:NAD(P)-dependent dehydrogenase (short-subunit alcohol dehydrogenase family)